MFDDKAFKDSSNDFKFDVDLYLNDEEDNGDNVVVPQTLSEGIKLMLAVATNMSCVDENDIRKDKSKDNLKE
uniref:Uncharacterized protein n=1 Tax=Tanacetum cinerariifolium TaxID=118510 RepID=A0A699KUV5_TANCI|nr:hypothetical protein [Tanacetum cinerariifolium]